MEIEFDEKAPFYERFVNVSVEKFLRTEMQRLSQELPTQQQPRRSNQKEPSKGALLFREFVNGILTVTENLIQSFNFNGCCYSISKNIYEFFHLEEKMRPLMRLNEPIFIYAYAWSCWRIGRENTDSPQQKQFRAKLERRIERIINGLKIHEDIILIEVSDLKANKFEDELLLPLVDKLIKEYCSHQFLNFLITVAQNCDLVETLKKVKELQKNVREYLNGSYKRENITEVKHEEIVVKYEVKREVKMEEEPPEVKTEEKPKQVQISNNDENATPVKNKIIKETTPKIFKKKYNKTGVVDHRRELFFEKFIKGAAISKYNTIKKEEDSTAHVTPINPQRSKRTLNDKVKAKISQKNDKKYRSIEKIRGIEATKSKTRRKITTCFGNQLVYIKRKKSSKVSKKNDHHKKPKKEDVLIDLKNAPKKLINDLSDCEFIEEEVEEETLEVYKSPNTKKPAEILAKKISSNFSKNLTEKSGTKSEPKISLEQQNELLRESSSKKNSASKIDFRRSSAKSSKNKVEVIDCESDNENFLTFEDWSQNIVAFSTPLKEKVNERALIDVSQKQLSFEGVGGI